MYYVYFLVDPRNNLPFYIGKGSGNRAKSHRMQRTAFGYHWKFVE